MMMAALICLDRAEVLHWYHSDPIAGLDGSTARELVRIGRASAVLDFLMDVLAKEGHEVAQHFDMQA